MFDAHVLTYLAVLTVPYGSTKYVNYLPESSFDRHTYPSELTINNSGAVYHHFMYYGDH